MGINWGNMWSLESDTAEAKAERTLWPFEHRLSPAEQQEFLDRAARTIVRRHLTTPALLFLESFRPLNFIGSQALLVLRPLLSAALSGRDLQALLNILEEREGLDKLLTLIEAYDRKDVVADASASGTAAPDVAAPSTITNGKPEPESPSNNTSATDPTEAALNAPLKSLNNSHD